MLDRSQLIPTGKETWAGVKVVIEAVLKQNKIVQNSNDRNRVDVEQKGGKFAI